MEVSAELAKQWSQVAEYQSALERVLGKGAAAMLVGELRREETALHAHARNLFGNWLQACVLNAST